jgi:hypothetical protein
MTIQDMLSLKKLFELAKADSDKAMQSQNDQQILISNAILTGIVMAAQALGINRQDL